jgi:hypothetical protein
LGQKEKKPSKVLRNPRRYNRGKQRLKKAYRLGGRTPSQWMHDKGRGIEEKRKQRGLERWLRG